MTAQKRKILIVDDDKGLRDLLLRYLTEQDFSVQAAPGGSFMDKLLNREVFHGQTWNYRKSGQPFMMNWYCYAIYGDHGKAIYYVAEQEDATELETLRMKQRLLLNPLDPDVNKFFAVLAEYKSARKQAR